MNSPKKPTPVDGKCSNCGAAGMTLAEDITDYSPCTLEDGEWVRGYTHEQYLDSDDSVRFFCVSCGTEHEVPDELA